VDAAGQLLVDLEDLPDLAVVRGELLDLGQVQAEPPG
jgi:hypothetical protein